MAAQDWIDKDFYATLGVSKDADETAIKKSYRKLARKYHPDQNPNDPASAEAKFKEVSEAYSVLSDKTQRQEYDQIRAYAGGAPRFQAGPGGATGGFDDIFGSMFSQGTPRTSNRYSNVSDEEFWDLLNSQHGSGSAGGSPFGRRSRFVTPQNGEDIAATIDLTFREAVQGITETLTVNNRTVTTRIPAGVNDGAKVRIRGKGHPGTAGGRDGDLVLTLRVAKHPVFNLDGKNVRVNVPVTFAEAAAGAEIEVPTIDGPAVKVKIPAGTPNGRVLRVRGKGAKTAKGQGDMLVKVEVTVPTSLNAEAKKALDEFTAALGNQDVRAALRSQAAR